MADDIDDLLDEVEDRYLKTKSIVKKPNQDKNCNNTFSSKPKKKTREEDDLDAAIDDIIGGTEVIDHTFSEKSKRHKEESCPISSQTTSSSLRKSLQKRCFPVYVGGSAIVVGVSSAMTERACDQLRCTSCDFKVVFYDNVQWDNTCDYLFFRNNVPDYQRLCSKLKKKKGSRAYACQCTWRSVTKLMNLVEEDIKWVCGKHPT
ncbi:cilia- and flagella-associated protein 418-like [Apostichopus japonicus]|uniref:cilia- and flagella-associated protein 418-like n=1 Tax=Stichopus japonicus TaxID=307972 RepID=UPI003AB8BD9C